MGDLKQHTFILSQAWKLKGQNQGLGSPGSFWGMEGEGVPCLFPSFWCLLKSLTSFGRQMRHPNSASVFTWHFPSISISVQISLFLERDQSYWIRAPPPAPATNDLILTWLRLQRPYLQIRPHVEVLGVRNSTSLLGGRDAVITHVAQGSGPSVLTDIIGTWNRITAPAATRPTFRSVPFLLLGLFIVVSQFVFHGP